MSFARKHFLCSCVLLMASAATVAQDSTELPFHLPVPKGWRTETIPFPLDFAPDLDYQGLEELRFSPGMFQEKKVDYWSYAFVWWVPESTEFDTERLRVDLATYFRGLNRSVGEARGFAPDDAEVRVQLEEAGDSAVGSGRWQGTARTVDVFTTRRSIRLNVTIDLQQCPGQASSAAVFLISPQPARNAIWRVLEGIRDGFRCQP